MMDGGEQMEIIMQDEAEQPDHVRNEARSSRPVSRGRATVAGGGARVRGGRSATPGSVRVRGGGRTSVTNHTAGLR